MKAKSRKVYTEEFKAEAIKMVLDSTESVPIIAERLGVKPSQLYGWMQSHRLPGEIKDMIAKYKRDGEEIKQLKRKIARLEQEKDILKKAATYFAKEAR